MSNIPERILDVHGELTRSERRLADLLLSDPDVLLLHSAAELADRAGVSKATTTRFFRRLGYASSKVAQREAREGADEGGGAVRPDRMALGKATLSKHLAAEMQNLVRSVEGLRPDELARAVGDDGARRQALGGGLRRQLPAGALGARAADPRQARHPHDPHRRLPGARGVRLDPAPRTRSWRSASAGGPARWARSCSPRARRRRAWCS